MATIIQTLRVKVVSGRASQADEARALDAAKAVFAAAGVTDYVAAHADWDRLRDGAEWTGDVDDATGHGRVWIEAEQAADLALTADYEDQASPNLPQSLLEAF